MAAAKTDQPELVTIRLMKDDNQYRDDVHVLVNGKAYLVKRGMEVQVPRAVAEVIENSRAQREAATAMSEQLAQDYEDACKVRGL